MKEPVFSHDWSSPYFPLWKRILSGRDIKSILEIGSYEGRSTIWFMENLNPSVVVCVDTFEGGTDHKDLVDFSGTKERFISNMEPYQGKFVLYVGESGDVLRRPSFVKGEFDLVFIDGSHMAKDVLQDAVISWRLLRNGGVMIFDDFGWGGDRPLFETPKPAIDGFLECYINECKLLEKGYQIIVEKL